MHSRIRENINFMRTLNIFISHRYSSLNWILSDCRFNHCSIFPRQPPAFVISFRNTWHKLSNFLLCAPVVFRWVPSRSKSWYFPLRPHLNVAVCILIFEFSSSFTHHYCRRLCFDVILVRKTLLISGASFLGVHVSAHHIDIIVKVYFNFNIISV